MNREPEQKIPSRRRFMRGLAGAAAVALAPAIVRAQAIPQVVVVGGGFAGATAAKYLRMWSNNGVGVTLIEPNPAHVSCVMSNLVLNNSLPMSALTLNYDVLRTRFGINIVADAVLGIDGANRRLQLRSGNSMAYDRLIVAPGIAFGSVSGWSAARAPHAWIAGSQTSLLRTRLQAVPVSGRFIMTIPKSPYRCPPGPYERACLVADFLGRRNGIIGGRPKGAPPKVIVLDANEFIQAERATFTRAFTTIYRDIVQYYPNATLKAVDPLGKSVSTTAGDFAGDLVNIIPPQRAPALLTGSGLTAGGLWAPVNPISYESGVPGFAGVHIIGDAQATRQPKSAHMANSQAKVCADAVLRMLAGQATDGTERLRNLTTNSACYSPITNRQASWLTAVYAYNAATGSMDVSSLAESERWSSGQYEDMFGWSQNLWADSFR